jgi:hypothetical protein
MAMADEEDVNEDDLEVDIGPNDMVVIVQKGVEYEPSEGVTAALEQLAQALAAEETSEVAAYSFSGGMALEAGFSGPEPTAIGCIRIGCLRGGGGGTTMGCTPSKVVVRCPCKGGGNYTIVTQ